MPVTRTQIFGSVFAAGLIAASISSPTLAGAVVGATQQAPAGERPEPALDDLKAAFKRPVTIPFPADNPYTPEKAALGKVLYYDPRLSVGHILSCGSCHNPGFGWG